MASRKKVRTPAEEAERRKRRRAREREYKRRTAARTTAIHEWRERLTSLERLAYSAPLDGRDAAREALERHMVRPIPFDAPVTHRPGKVSQRGKEMPRFQDERCWDVV